MDGIKKTGLLVLFGMAFLLESRGQLPPELRISNGIIDARVYVPDAANGYYRATRFDWSGVMPSLDFKGHSFFGQWFETYSPEQHDAIVGPVEAFDPIGYAEVTPGGSFTKIGVGLLGREDTLGYRFSQPYPIVDPGRWHVEPGRDEVRFTHVLDSGAYPYTYQKRIRLAGNRMVLEHTLMNRGDRTIDTYVYNHNFFVIDEDPVGLGYLVRFPFQIAAGANRLGEFARVDGNRIEYLGRLGKLGRPNLRDITGYRPVAEDHVIFIENQHRGAGVRIIGDRPIAKLDVWSAEKTVCPEPYIHIYVEPSSEFSWSTTYDFYTF